MEDPGKDITIYDDYYRITCLSEERDCRIMVPKGAINVLGWRKYIEEDKRRFVWLYPGPFKESAIVMPSLGLMSFHIDILKNAGKKGWFMEK